jgi:hypothetical protein
MGRQLQLATTQPDEVELLSFIRSLAPIHVFLPFAPSRDELWVDDWETRKIPKPKFYLGSGFYIWPQTFPWSPEYAQTGGPNCRPEAAGQFYIANKDAAPIFHFSRSFLDEHSYGRIYWARDFSAPDGLDYDVEAFARFTDSRTPDIGGLRMSAFLLRTPPEWRSADAVGILERWFWFD